MIQNTLQQFRPLSFQASAPVAATRLAPTATPAPDGYAPSRASNFPELKGGMLHPQTEHKAWQYFSNARLMAIAGTGLAIASLAVPGLNLVGALALGVGGLSTVGASRAVEHEGHKVLRSELPEWKAELQSPDGIGQLARLNPKPDELELLRDMVNTKGGSEHFEDMFQGAHIIVPDSGKFYDEWSHLQSAEKRESSHQSSGAQYEISGHITGPVLFGKTADGTGTWLQFERDPIDKTPSGLAHAAFHMGDYLQYKLSGDNISRYGHSPHTDRNPLTLG